MTTSNNKFKFWAFALLIIGSISVISCSDKPIDDDDVITNPDSTSICIDKNTPLKDEADFLIGTAVDIDPILNDQTYLSIVKSDFDIVTLGNHMKHGFIVQNDGSLDFTNADKIINTLGPNIQIFGHTLGWHQSQNVTFLNNFAGLVEVSETELLSNGSFESGTTSQISNWTRLNTGNPAGSSTITITAETNEVHVGAQALKVENPTAYPTEQWRVQLASDYINTTIGKKYLVSYMVKSAKEDGSIRLSTGTESGGSPAYQSDQKITKNWQRIKWEITANALKTRIVLDMGQKANTYFIDDVSVKEINATSGQDTKTRVNQALESFVKGSVSKYKGRVKAWDVINEVMTDAGVLRTNANTLNSNSGSDVFVWTEYLGEDYVMNAFKWAAETDPSADLYINDYNLESSTAKLNATIELVKKVKANGIKIDGIGTQMHILSTTSKPGIENMIKKLVETGLKVRISELDIRAGYNPSTGQMSAAQQTAQKEMYRFVVATYLKFVPVNQRGGISVWGIDDKNSWLYNGGKEFPLLYDNDYKKKPAYYGFLCGLKQ